MITKEIASYDNRGIAYYPLLKSVFCLNQKILLNKIARSEKLLISSIKGAKAFLYNLSFCQNLENNFLNKSFIVIGNEAFKLLKDKGFNLFPHPFKNFSALEDTISIDKSILYISGFETCLTNEVLQKIEKIILYKAYLKPFCPDYAANLHKFKYIFVYSKITALYLNSLPLLANTTFVCISPRVAKIFTKNQKILYPLYPSEEAMLELINL